MTRLLSGQKKTPSRRFQLDEIEDKLHNLVNNLDNFR